MSILITGLEMPTERESFNLTIKYNGTVLDTETGMQIAEAHELQPHGRLINAEQLKETLDYYIREAGWSAEINKALNWVKDEFINSEPTIIPASEEGET